MPYFLSPAVSVPLKPYPKAQSLPSSEHREAKQPSRFHRTSSWSGWVRSVLPSHRAERGGTLRNQGFWEVEESRRPGIRRPRRHVTDSWQSRRSETHGPDHIVRWNTAKDLPGTQPGPAQPRFHAAPANARMPSNADPPGAWSWSPMDEAELCQAREGQGQGQGADAQPASQHGWPDKVTAATASEARAISTIERQLAQTRQTIEARKEARHQRLDLKESGDYLGVQGINPATGQLDMITLTDSEGNRTSPETQQRPGNLRNAPRDARQSYKDGEAQSEIEIKWTLESDRDRLVRLEMDKQTPRNFSQRVMWRRQTKQWSLAQEPGLSPIAQSHVDHYFGSQNTTENQAAEQRPEPPIGGRLVDLTCPTGAPTSSQRAAEQQSRDPRVGSPSSTSTVIRTPKWQSFADLTPSAWELFENGISFDNSETSEPGQQLGIPAAVPASADATQHRVAHGPPGWSPDCVVVSRVKTRHVQAATPDRPAGKRNDGLVKAPSEDFRLDKRVETAINPGGPKKGNWHVPASIRTASEESRSISSKPQCEDVGSSTPLQGAASSLGDLSERTHPGPGRELCTAEATNLDPLTQARGRKVNARGQLRKLMPPLAYFRTKRMDGSRNQLNTREEKACPPALSSMANLGRLETCEGQETIRGNQGLQEPEAARGMMGGSLPTVAHRTSARDHVASIESPGLEAWRMDPIQVHEDREWVEQALKDITDKGNELLEEFASTHNTTTTGYDRLASCSNQTVDDSAKTRGRREDQLPVTRRQVSRLLYNLASPSPSKYHDTEAPAASSSPNTWPSLGLTGPGVAADCTSTSSLADSARPTGGPGVASFAWAAVEQQSSEGECSALRISMSTPAKCRGYNEGESQEPDGQAMVTETEEGERAKASGAAKTDERPLEPPIQTADDQQGLTAKEDGEDEKQYVQNPPADGQVARQTDVMEEDTEVASPWTHMPGGFPAPPEVQVGRADGVEGTSIGEADMDMKARGTNQCRTWVSGATRLLSLYLESIRPVLDPRSEYWERNAKHETTLADGLALALAMPVAILGAVALV